jgi:hypothetical protein
MGSLTTVIARKTKKSETLQVRLPYGMKRDFMERVQLENRSASDLIRDFIESYLAGPVEILASDTAVLIRRRFIYPTLIAAGLVGAVVLFMPNPGDAGTLRLEFRELDRNRDGFIDVSEYKRPQTGALLPPPRSPDQQRAVPGPDGIAMFGPDGAPLRRKIVINQGPKPQAGPGEVVLTVRQSLQYSINGLDMDGDRQLNFAEYKAARVRGMRREFDQVDTNLDDRVSPAEFAEQGLEPISRERIAALTPAQKARLDRSYAAHREKARVRFKELDLDRNGMLTRDEMVPA